MRNRLLAASTLALSIATTAAMADNVDFTAALTNTCSLTASTPGLMALSADGTVLGSQEIGGAAAAISVLSIGSSTLTVGAPSMPVAPVEYDAANETIEVAYNGTGGLSTVTQGYTSGQTTVALNTLPLSILAVNARVTNPDSFSGGAYTVRTVVTCS